MPTIETSMATDIESPCNRACVVHPLRRLCVGCGRTLDEIGRWIELSEAERSRIMAQLPSRLASLTGVITSPAMTHGDD